MPDTINARIPLCGLSVFVHSITLRKASGDSRKNYYQHRHPGFEIHCLTAGDCHVTCNDKSYFLEPGMMLLLPPETYHDVTDTPNKTARISICFSLDRPESIKDGSVTKRFYRAFDRSEPVIMPLRNTEAQQLLEKMESHLQSAGNDPYRKDKLLTLCCAFLLELAALLETEENHQPSTVAGESSQEAYWIDTFLARNFMHNDAMARMADALHISTRQLHRTITKHYGINYRQKLSEIRLKIATDMLCNTDMPIHRISEVLGYSNSANFSAFIKRCTNKTPSQLRNQKGSELWKTAE